jgi:hypothetical protein
LCLQKLEFLPILICVSQINPFAGSILQSTNVQRTQAAEKDRALQKARDKQKNSAGGTDLFEHTVESSEAIPPSHDDEDTQDPRKRKQKKRGGFQQKNQEGDKPRLDLRA